MKNQYLPFDPSFDQVIMIFWYINKIIKIYNNGLNDFFYRIEKKKSNFIPKLGS